MPSASPSVARPFACPVFEPGDPGYAAEVAAFHPNIVHSPEIVVGAGSATDVAAAIDFAREQGLRVAVQGGRHGTAPATSGLLITTHHMNQVAVDAGTRVATIGGGALWSDVIAVAAPHGLMPITGSTSHVGAVGYLLGGGVSILGRSHGYSSDHVLGFTVVTAAGEVVEASATSHPDLFWALRGGKSGLGVVTEARVRLHALPTLYAGSIAIEEAHIEPALRGWLDWTQGADDLVTTSAAIIDFPEMELVPPPFRGKRLLFLRFAYPGDEARGAELAAPLRALAPIFLDDLGLIPSSQMDRIHNDPTEPIPFWGSGAQLTHADQEFATRWLDRFGSGAHHPFAVVEIRHGGSAQAVDVPEGSAVTGRSANYTLFLAAMFPPLFAEAAPAAAAEAMDAFRPWVLPEVNVNFIEGNTVARPWSPETQARLDEVRRRYDPEGVFTLRW
jgi:FAD/FMN-containing dehydrogenase